MTCALKYAHQHYLLFKINVMHVSAIFLSCDVFWLLSSRCYQYLKSRLLQVSFQKHPEASKWAAFWGSFPCLCLRQKKQKTTKNESTRKNLGMQDKHIVKIKKYLTPTTNPKNQNKNMTNFSKAELISSHTATITNTETFPKWIKDLKTKHKIFYSGKTRK